MSTVCSFRVSTAKEREILDNSRGVQSRHGGVGVAGGVTELAAALVSGCGRTVSEVAFSSLLFPRGAASSSPSLKTAMW